MRPTKRVYFGGIARHGNVDIMLFEPKKGRGKGTGSIWRLDYGKTQQHENNLPTINMGY